MTLNIFKQIKELTKMTRMMLIIKIAVINWMYLKIFLRWIKVKKMHHKKMLSGVKKGMIQEEYWNLNLETLLKKVKLILMPLNYNHEIQWKV